MDTLLSILLENRLLLLLLGVALIGLTWLRRRKPIETATQKKAVKPKKVTRGSAERDAPSEGVAQEEPAPDQIDLNDLSEGLEENSLLVAEVDPMEEAQIYLQYGYYDRAAELLRWIADKSESPEPQLLRLLLEIYQRLKRIDDDYAKILEQLILVSGADAYTRQALLDGLKLDPKNLPLRVLALDYFGLDVKQVNALIDFETQGAWALPQTKKEPGATTVHTLQTTTSISEHPNVSATTARVHQPLVTGRARLSPLTTDECRVVRAFLGPSREAKLHILSHNQADALPALERAIRREPRVLANYTELLKIHHARRDIESFARTLWQLYTVLGNAGRALREEMLALGFTLGHHPVLESLAQCQEASQIEAIGLKFGYLVQESTPRRKLELISTADSSFYDPLSKRRDKIVEEVESYLAYGQVDHAIERLEEAILADPAAVHLYPTLLDIYERMDDYERFKAFALRLKQHAHRPPEEVVAMLTSLYQRFKDRRVKIAA